MVFGWLWDLFINTDPFFFLECVSFSKDQLNLLKIGLEFCPTTKINIGKLKKEIKEFERKFRLIENSKIKKSTDDSLVNNKTKFFPDKNNNSELNTFFVKLWNINLKK